MVMTEEIKHEKIQELKRRALELKKEGDIEGAKAILAQIREIEFGDVSVEDLTDPASLKKLAIILKNKGDLGGAKEALLKAKRIEAQASVGDNDNNNPSNTQLPSRQFSSRRKLTSEVSSRRQLQAVNSTRVALTDSLQVADSPEKNQNDKIENSPVDDDRHHEEGIHASDEEGTTSSSSMGSLGHGDEFDDDDDDDGDILEEGVTYTDEEMQDLEMMTEFKLGGMEVPSEEDYKERILSCKKAALAAKKEGDIVTAKEQLLNSKKLQQVMTVLSHMNEGLGLRINHDEEGWIETMTSEETCMVEDMFGSAETELDLEDLEDMDPDMIRDAVEAGMKIPSVDGLLDQAKQKKQEAVQMKQLGDIEGAKSALIESKKLQKKAEQVTEILKTIEGDEDAIDIEDLLENVESQDKDRTGPKEQPKKEVKPVPTKSAAELKAEIFQLKAEKKIKEATAMLKLYKETLAKENMAAEQEKKKEIILQIEKEVSLSKEQQHLFMFYERLVDMNIGKAQRDIWEKYANQCISATKLVEKNGSEFFTIERSENSNMLQIQGNVMDMMKKGVDASDPRLEVSIVQVSNIHENKYFIKEKKRKEKELKESGKNGSTSDSPPKLRVETVIQLPKEEENTDDIKMVFVPTIIAKENDKFTFSFDYSQNVDLPRGKSRHAKMIMRRLPRKKIVISVFQTFQQKKDKGWFRSSKREEEKEIPPLFIGKVIFELKEFLKCNCLGGDFPLMDSSGHRPVGGQISLGIRTGVPFDPDLLEEEEEEILESFMMPQYLYLSFTPNSTQ